VGPYALSPDLAQLAYIANQDSVDEWDLYIVDLANPGTSTKVNPEGDELGIFVFEFAFSPDGSQIVYNADQEGVLGQFELFLVDLDNPGVSTRLNPDLPPDRVVSNGMSFSPDGSRVLYVADLDVPGQFEAYLVDVATPGVATKVNGPFVPGGNVIGAPKFSPDGATIVYMADQDVDTVLELYAVDVSNPGVSAKLNPPLVTDGDLCTFHFSPDSTKVGYCADQDVDGVLDLYVVDLAVPGVSAKVNPPLVADGDVQSATFRFGPDSDFIVYRADQDVDGDNELYRVELATPGVSAKINEPLPPGGDVSFFRINPDGLQLIYAADQDTEGVAELYNVDLSTPGVATKLNPERDGTQISQIEINEDGSQAFYLADQDAPGTGELYRVDLASAGTATKINSTLPANGSLFDFAISPEYREPQ
jgi:Tol biopolymer transport system component